MLKAARTTLTLLVLVPAAAAAQKPAPDTLPLTLESAVVRALRAGDEARLADAQVDLAGAQMAAARSAVFPQLRLSSTYGHVLESARGQAVGSIFNQPNTYNSYVNLSQPIFQGGRAIAGWRSGSKLLHAAEMSGRETAADVAMSVVQAYLQALLTQQLVAIQDTNYTLATAQLRQVEEFEQAGRAAHYDVLRARVAQANIEPLLIQARSDRDIAMLDLKRLLNVPAETPLGLTTTIDPDAVAALATRMADLPGTGESRASLQAAELTARARHDAIGVARADLLPTISVYFQTGYQAYPRTYGIPTSKGQLSIVDCPAGSTPGRVCTQQNGGWFSDRSFGVQLSWPLFDGLQTKANIDVAQAQARIADLQLAQARETVALQVAQARAEFKRAQSLFAARRQNADEAREAFRLASLRYGRGLSTQLEVQDAQVALMTARTNAAQATHDLYLAAAGVARALGRPIPLPDGSPLPTELEPRSNGGE